MPTSTNYLDSYNASLDKINTCIMSTIYSPDNSRLVASDDQGRLAVFNSLPSVSSKPIFLTAVSSNGTTNTLNNNIISLASSASEVLILAGGTLQNSVVQGFRWSDILSHRKANQLPADIFSFDLTRSPGELLACVQAPLKCQQPQKQSEIIVGSSTGTLRTLNIERHTLVTTIESAHKGAIHQVAFAFDGKRVASCSEDGTCKIWDLMSSNNQPIFTIEMNRWISCCAFDPSTDRLILGGDCPLSMWPSAMLSSTNKHKPLIIYNNIPTPIYSIAFCSDDDDTILVGGETNKLYSIPKNSDEHTTLLSRNSSPSPIYTLATTNTNQTKKDYEEIRIAVGGSHWQIDAFTIGDSNLRKLGCYEFSK